MGNICRSPLAEGIFSQAVREQRRDAAYRIDSAGIGDWHVGQPADPRSAEVARRHGIALSGRARQVKAPQDFERFDFIFAMDGQNLRDLQTLSPGHAEKIRLIRSFDPQGGDGAEVPDPYYGGKSGFENVFDMLDRSCRNLLAALEQSGGRLP